MVRLQLVAASRASVSKVGVLPKRQVAWRWFSEILGEDLLLSREVNPTHGDDGQQPFHLALPFDRDRSLNTNGRTRTNYVASTARKDSRRNSPECQGLG